MRTWRKLVLGSHLNSAITTSNPATTTRRGLPKRSFLPLRRSLGTADSELNRVGLLWG
jgi:hypothetical protein